MPRLAVDKLSKRFGGAVVLDQLSFEVDGGRVLGIIGPNGSGKTTLVNVLNGVYRPTRGTITLDGERIEGRSPHRLIRLGISRTFQNPRVFQSLTLLENLLMVTDGMGREARSASRARELLEFVGLADFADSVASELSGGQKKLAEFARALMTEPRLVLMDEPFAGIHPTIKDSLMSRIRETCDERGITYLVVSHEVSELVALSDQFLCIAEGKVLAAGSPRAVSEDPQVIEAYLGMPVGAA
ncbi:MAG TPA: ABC transporter ATP-binding protein [Acidimicrobiales bacterium]|nr:ABC transporter ATP-binding protein [Acidimicrobiales bacterium]